MSEPTPQPYFRTPAVSPDGDMIAFVYAGDIWAVPIGGGAAERLTAHPAAHHAPRFSPDGRQLAFTSGRSGSGDLHVLPLDGGELRQLTFRDDYCHAEDWAADGDAIYFTSSREQLGPAIYRVGLDGGQPAMVYAEPYESLGQLSASPDGDHLAFANTRERWWRRGPNPYAPAEIWVGPARPDYAALRQVAGPGSALAEPHAGRNCWPLWAPDGVGLFFVSDRDGAENLWYQPLEGGPPRQVTRFRDGRLLFPAIARRAGTIVFEREWRLWRLDPAGGQAEPIPIRARADTKYTPVRVETWTRGFSELRLAPDGRKLAFVARGEIFADFADKETDRELRQGPAFRVTDTSAREGQVAWTPSSGAVVYVSDRHGEDELYCYDFAAQAERRLTDDPAPKRLPKVSPDGSAVAFIRGQDAIHLLDLNTPGAQPHELCRSRFLTAADLVWSPDSRWIAFLGQDERFFSNVYVVPAAGGRPRQITFLSNVDGGDLRWAPNGQFVIFTTGQYRAEAQIVRVDLRPPQPVFREAEFERLFDRRQGDRGTAGQGGRGTGGHGEPPPEKQPPAGDPPAEPEPKGDPPPQPTPHDDPPAGDPPADEPPQGDPPVERRASEQVPADDIVFEGIERRLRFLTPTQMNASAEAISPDSRDLLLIAVVAGKLNVWSLPLDEPRADQPPRQLTASESHKGFLQYTPDGRAFFYLDDGVITMRKFPQGGDPVRLNVRAEVNVDFHREKRQIFDESWRALRDSFYDPTFRGQDWGAVRERFRPLAAGAQTTEELHTAINLMVGELRASHLGSGFAGWSGYDGYTGILFDPHELLERGHLRVLRVLPDSPAALLPAPPRRGEYLRAVDGRPLAPGDNLDRAMRRSVGRRVRLTLADAPEGGAAREVALRPIGADAYAHLRYRDWVLANEAYVHRASAGQLGYVHIEQMSYGAYQQFLADLDAEAHSKAGVIVDVRYNGGGHTATFVLDVLTRRSSLLSGFRERAGAGTDASHLAGNRVLNKPTVLVTNERSMSNTEMLSESYRRMGLGRVVGRPTAGAVIWTYGMRLLDGASLRLPRFFVVTPEGEDLEGKGRPVDIDVARPLGEWALDRDRQLDAAVAALLGQSS